MGPQLPNNPQNSLPPMGQIPMDPGMIPPSPGQQVPPGAGSAITALTDPNLQGSPVEQALEVGKKIQKLAKNIQDPGFVQILNALTGQQVPPPQNPVEANIMAGGPPGMNAANKFGTGGNNKKPPVGMQNDAQFANGVRQASGPMPPQGIGMS